MTCFKRSIFTFKLKMLITHGVLFLGIVFLFVNSILNNISFYTAIFLSLVLLVFEQLLDNFLINKKLDINEDEFLHYKYCKLSGNCDCRVDTLLEIIFKHSPELITIKDVKFRYIMCSGLFINLLDYYSVQDIIGKIPDEIFSESQAAIINNYHSRVLKEKTPQTYSLSFPLKSGGDVTYELISAPIMSNNDVVGVLTLGRDITETSSSRYALEFSNSKLNVLINNSPMMAYILDIEGNFILGNDRARSFILAGTDITIDGERIRFDIDYIKAEILEENDKIVKSGKAVENEKRLLAKNGEKYWYRVHKAPIKDNNGKVYAISTFAVNIEKEKRIDEQRETYIATLTHDLKTPTIAQIRALELLLSGQLGTFNEEQKEMLKLTLDSCKYMYDMVYTLLSTYKFENGDIALTYSSFDLVEVISDSINELSNIASENAIKLEFSYSGDKCSVCADKIEIKRVIINLLSNAINYAYSSTVVYVSLQSIGDNVEVRVKNSSKYIDPDSMAKLFRKYVTHSEKFNKVGIGLGLYLSKKIIDAHNGKIIAESSQDQHNTFGFIIPLACTSSVYTCDKI